MYNAALLSIDGICPAVIGGGILFGGGFTAEEEMFFTVNWRKDITAGDCFVEYKGVFYDVTRIDTFEGYKEDLKLYTAMLASQPKPGDIEPWKG